MTRGRPTGDPLLERPTPTATEESPDPGMAPSPAYYAQGTTGWRAWWTLLHPPYTAMHLGFVVLGAALAPTLLWDRLAWTLLAFLLAMGLAAHALDEHQGRPLQTRIPGKTLLFLAAAGLLGAVTLGIWGALYYQLTWGLLFIPVGVLLVVAYNLELFGGRLHNGPVFLLAWGAFPVLVGYFAQTGRIDPVVLLAALYAMLASGIQRALSTPARRLRRDIHKVTGHFIHNDGTTSPVTRRMLLSPHETALRLLVAANLTLAGLLIAIHLI